MLKEIGKIRTFVELAWHFESGFSIISGCVMGCERDPVRWGIKAAFLF
jgi:hypothetical protein